MSVRRRADLRAWHICLAMNLLAWPGVAQAQNNVGTGPLTVTLADTEPTVGAFSLGPVRVAPGITVREIGTTSNVFDEATDPKDDFVAVGTPDLAAYAQLGWLKISAYGGVELTYYRTYVSERSVGYAGRARMDLLLSRLRPFVAGGQTKTRERANGEIDTRAERLETEQSGGLAFAVSAHSTGYISAVRLTTAFSDALDSGVNLAASLNRDTDDFNIGFQTALTPLTTVTLRGGYTRDLFHDSPERNADTRYINAAFAFAPEAALNGSITVGYADFVAVDPLIVPYRGLTAAGGVTIPFGEIGRLRFTVGRGPRYSFDTTEAYYRETTLGLMYTHRIVGAVDVQVSGSRSLFNYGNRAGSGDRQDHLDLVAGGLGYNLRNRSRVALTYEYGLRRSPELAERNYDRRRVFLSWTYAL